MDLIDSVATVEAGEFGDGFQEFLHVVATGHVNTTGWTRFWLADRVYFTPPADGILDISFLGDPPVGIVGDVVLPVGAMGLFRRPPWATGVRVHSKSNFISANINQIKTKTLHTNHAVSKVAGHTIWSRDLAIFDDSFQPTGTIHWHGWTPHAEMKKLRHTLTLVVEGPDQHVIENCFRQAATAGIIAGIIAAYATAGAGLAAALSAFTTALTGCLGAAYSVRIDNHSHWIYWDT